MFQLSKHVDMCLKVTKLELVIETVGVLSPYVRNLMNKKPQSYNLWPKSHDTLQVSQQPSNLVLAYGFIWQWLLVDYYCSDTPVLGCNLVSCEAAPVAAVCLQPLSVDLWLQVLIMAANFKGLVGSVPTTASSCPRGPFVCTCAQEERRQKWAVGWLAILLVCALLCVCVYVPLSSGFNRDLGRVWKAQATPHTRQATVGRGDESKAWPNTGSPSNWEQETVQGGPSERSPVFLCIHVYMSEFMRILIYRGNLKRCMAHILYVYYDMYLLFDLTPKLSPFLLSSPFHRRCSWNIHDRLLSSMDRAHSGSVSALDFRDIMVTIGPHMLTLLCRGMPCGGGVSFLALWFSLPFEPKLGWLKVRSVTAVHLGVMSLNVQGKKNCGINLVFFIQQHQNDKSFNLTS